MQKEEPFLSRITFMEKRTQTFCWLCPYMFMFVVYLRSGFFLFCVDCLDWPAQNPWPRPHPADSGWRPTLEPDLITDISGGSMLNGICGSVFVRVKPLDIFTETDRQFSVMLVENMICSQPDPLRVFVPKPNPTISTVLTQNKDWKYNIKKRKVSAWKIQCLKILPTLKVMSLSTRTKTIFFFLCAQMDPL